MNKPKLISRSLGNYTLEFADLGICVEVERLSDKGIGEAAFWYNGNGDRKLLHRSNINLLSTQTCNQLVKRLSGNAKVDWATVLTYVTSLTLDEVRRGEPAVTIATTDKVTRPRYLIYPLVIEGQPNFIYGPGGTGKSNFAIYIATCLTLPWHDNPLKLKTIEEPTSVLYLDWETTQAEITWRLKSLQEGMGLATYTIEYRRCSRPLSAEIEAIKKVVAEKSIKCVIVDSVAAACGGELKDAEPALRFFESLRGLNLTSILIAHTPKETFNSAGKEVYGSVFFTNYGRNNWELKKEQEVGDEELTMGLFHRKSNMSKLHKPIGCRFRFSDNSMAIEPADLKESGLAINLPLKDRIRNRLGGGPQDVKELTIDLDTTEATVRDCLNRHKDLFIKNGDKWKLNDNE